MPSAHLQAALLDRRRCCSRELTVHSAIWCASQEAECFVRAASLPVHKALVWTFLGQRATQRVRPWLRCRAADCRGGPCGLLHSTWHVA